MLALPSASLDDFELALPRDPRQNALLRSLPYEDLRTVGDQLELIRLPLGHEVYECGGPLRHGYFPLDCVVSFSTVMEDGYSMGVALTGREGFVGLSLLTGSDRSLARSTVQMQGYAYRIRARSLAELLERSPALRKLLFGHMQRVLVQVAQIATCRRHHVIEQQLCLWLLLMLDRSREAGFQITQEMIALNLGVRREGVTEAIRRLQGAGVIACRRRHVTVVDRTQLEALVCECYRSMRGEPQRRATGELHALGR